MVFDHRLSLVLGALGVGRDVIMEDYLLTNETNRPKAEALYRRQLETGTSEIIAAFIREAYLAKEEYLNSVWMLSSGKRPEKPAE